MTESTLMQSMKNRMSSLLSRLAAAKVKPMTKEQIQKLYGSNTVFDFKSREQKIHHHRSTGAF